MHRCTRCSGFVPVEADACPNCRSTSRAWWMAPLAIAGAGLASVTLSACYGPACATAVTLPDGGTLRTYGNANCMQTYDCREPLPDGGPKEEDLTWQLFCNPPTEDAGTDGGNDGGG